MVEFILIATLAWHSPHNGALQQKLLQGRFDSFEACQRHVLTNMEAVEAVWKRTPVLLGTELCVERKKVQ